MKQLVKPNRTGKTNGEPDRPPHRCCDAADRGAGGDLESAWAMKEAAN